MRLRLVINNTNDLSGGYRAVNDFDENGGIIGSSDDCTWQIVDRVGTIHPHHIEVQYIDQQFCVTPLAREALSINASKSFIKPGEQVQITDGDTLMIGRFEMSAFVEMTIGEAEELNTRGERWARRFVSLGTLVNNAENEEVTAKNLFESKALRREGSIEMHERMNRAQQIDPVDLIEKQNESRSTYLKDPVALFDREMKAESDVMATKVSDIINIEPEKGNKAEIPDDLQPGSAYMAMPTVKHASNRDKRTPPPSGKEQDRDSYLEGLASSARAATEAQYDNIGDIAVRDRFLGDVNIEDADEEQLVDHVVLRPLCIALGLPIQNMSVPKANQLAKDIGEGFKAAVEGLMAAHRRELSDKSHLAETHLHAIEDNPLRHDKSVNEVIQDLLLIKSPVHLSARSAIEESLELIQYHERASEVAADEALDAVLLALGPVALAKRFKKYKGHAPRAGDLDAWHWEMYQHYYAEIRSEQQGGLSRMFWEVYRQVYDREMRRLTLEG